MADPRQDFLRQAVAATWATSQLSAQDWNLLCQQFVEEAYGTRGRYPTAAAASNALFKSPDLTKAKPGALVFFAADDTNQQAGHAGIYLGGDRMVSATPQGVRVTGIKGDPYYASRFVGWGDAPPEWRGRNVGDDLRKGAEQLVDRILSTTAKTAEAAGDRTMPAAVAAPTAPSSSSTPPYDPSWQPGGSPYDSESAPTVPPPGVPPPTEAPTTLQRMVSQLKALDEAITQARTNSRSSDPFIAGKATEALPDLLRQQTALLTQVSQEENRTRDDANKAPAVVLLNGQPHIWNPKAQEYQPIAGTVPTKEKPVTFQNWDGRQMVVGEDGEARPIPGQGTPPGPTPKIISENGRHFPIDPATGQPILGQVVDTRSPEAQELEKAKIAADTALAALAKRAADVQEEREALRARLKQEFDAGTKTKEAALKEIADFDAFNRTEAQRLAAEAAQLAQARDVRERQTEDRARLTEESQQTGMVADFATGKLTDRQTESARAKREAEEISKRGAAVAESGERRMIADLASELGSNAVGTAMFRTPGGYNPNAARSMPDVPGDPNESIGMRILRRMGVVGGAADQLRAPGVVPTPLPVAPRPQPVPVAAASVPSLAAAPISAQPAAGPTMGTGAPPPAPMTFSPPPPESGTTEEPPLDEEEAERRRRALLPFIPPGYDPRSNYLAA